MSLNTETLEKKLKDNKVVLIDFWAAWCGPCRMLTPIMDDMENLYPNQIGKVNVDEERDLATKYGVRSLPTVIFLTKQVFIIKACYEESNKTNTNTNRKPSK